MIDIADILQGIASAVDYTLFTEPQGSLPRGPREAMAKISTVQLRLEAGGRLVHRLLKAEISALLPGDNPHEAEAAFVRAWWGLLPWISFAGRKLPPLEMTFSRKDGVVGCVFLLDFVDTLENRDNPLSGMNTLEMGGRYE